jgi:tRNA threonylcarbamoyladenosine biosynthesis protein TsaE
MTSVVTHDAGETRALGRALATVLAPGDVVLLAGGLGAGKTELTKGIAEGLDCDAPVVSPTFTLAREYQGRIRLLHVDVYRLEDGRELTDLGLEDLAGDDAVTVVEWGDTATAYFPAERLDVRIELDTDADAVRRITFAGCGASWAQRAPALAEVLAGSGR